MKLKKYAINKIEEIDIYIFICFTPAATTLCAARDRCIFYPVLICSRVTVNELISIIITAGTSDPTFVLKIHHYNF